MATSTNRQRSGHKSLVPGEALKRAYEWREAWRAEMADCRRAKEQPPKRHQPLTRQAPTPDQKTKFAEAIARSEFGRDYWNKRLNQPRTSVQFQ